MILPPGFRGAAFATAADGDARRFAAARRRLSHRLGVPDAWAYPTQVHGAAVAKAEAAGRVGEADGVFTTVIDLPVAVATADCAPIILEGPAVVAVLHAGWRGATAGVVPAVLAAIKAAGHVVSKAAIGPSIGPCCYAVGSEVADRFDDHTSTTRWGTASVDIAGFVAAQLGGIEVWRSDVCTFDSTEFHSYRRSKTKDRQVAVGWIPSD